MFRIFSLLTVVFMSVPLFAQEPAAIYDLTFNPSGWGRQLVPMSNTINNNIIFFYEDRSTNNQDEPTKIKLRIVRTDGTMSPAKVIVDDVRNRFWTVAWNKSGTRYMLVYRSPGSYQVQDGKIYARWVKVNGDAGPAKYITDHSDTYFRVAVAPTKKKRFAIFYQNNGQVVCQMVRKNAAKYKGELQLTNVSEGEAYPVAAAGDGGLAFCYYGHYSQNSDKTIPHMLKVNFKGQVKKTAQIADASHMADGKTTFYANYHPKTKHHYAAWAASYKNNKYTVLGRDGASVVKPPTALPTSVNFVKGLHYYPTIKEMTIFHYNWDFDQANSLEKNYFYFLVFTNSGNIQSAANKIHEVIENNELDGYGFGFGRSGYMLLAWAFEDLGGKRGIYGRLRNWLWIIKP